MRAGFQQTFAITRFSYQYHATINRSIFKHVNMHRLSSPSSPPASLMGEVHHHHHQHQIHELPSTTMYDIPQITIDSSTFKYASTYKWPSPSSPPASLEGKVHHLRRFQIHLTIVTTSYNQHLTMWQWPLNIICLTKVLTILAILDFLQSSRTHTHAWCVVEFYISYLQHSSGGQSLHDRLNMQELC